MREIFEIMQWETGPGGEDEECLDAGSGEEPQDAQQGDPSARLFLL